MRQTGADTAINAPAPTGLHHPPCLLPRLIARSHLLTAATTAPATPQRIDAASSLAVVSLARLAVQGVTVLDTALVYLPVHHGSAAAVPLMFQRRRGQPVRYTLVWGYCADRYMLEVLLYTVAAAV